jgi:hypothetical protein
MCVSDRESESPGFNGPTTYNHLKKSFLFRLEGYPNVNLARLTFSLD